MITDLYLEKNSEMEQQEGESLPFRELVGSLMFLAVTSRPDIMFAVARLSLLFVSYGEVHWN